MFELRLEKETHDAMFYEVEYLLYFTVPESVNRVKLRNFKQTKNARCESNNKYMRGFVHSSTGHMTPLLVKQMSGKGTKLSNLEKKVKKEYRYRTGMLLHAYAYISTVRLYTRRA